MKDSTAPDQRLGSIRVTEPIPAAILDYDLFSVLRLAEHLSAMPIALAFFCHVGFRTLYVLQAMA